MAENLTRNISGGCPVCANKKVLKGFNDLETLAPEVAREWHPTLNKDLLPSQVLFESTKKVWWLGKCGHEWETSVVLRAKGTGCPVCRNLKTIVGINDLKTLSPEIAKEWHPIKNLPLLCEEINSSVSKKIRTYSGRMDLQNRNLLS